LYISDFENQQDEDRFKQQCCEKHRTITSEDGRRPQQKIYRLVLVARRHENNELLVRHAKWRRWTLINKLP